MGSNTNRLLVSVWLVACGVGLSAAPREATLPGAQDGGEAAYTEAGCVRCHSVAVEGIEATVSERMRGPDLGSVGDDHDVDWVVGVVRWEIELDGRPHRMPFRGSDEQLAAIAGWLVGLAGRP